MNRPKFIPGTKVFLAEGDIPGSVLYAMLYPDESWMYEVAWWNEGQRLNAVFDASELIERKSNHGR